MTEMKITQNSLFVKKKRGCRKSSVAAAPVSGTLFLPDGNIADQVPRKEAAIPEVDVLNLGWQFADRGDGTILFGFHDPAIVQAGIDGLTIRGAASGDAGEDFYETEGVFFARS